MARKTKKVPETSALELAEQLGALRGEMAALKEHERSVTHELLLALHKEGLRFAGNYHIVQTTTFKPVVEELALKFALERGLTKIDTSKVRKVFQLDTTLRFADPAKFGFEIVTQEKINPMRGAQEEDA